MLEHSPAQRGAAAWPHPIMLAKTEIMPEFDARKNAPLCSHYAGKPCEFSKVGELETLFKIKQKRL